MGDKDEGLSKRSQSKGKIEILHDPYPLGPNPTVAQIKIYEDVKSRKLKALTCIRSTLSDMIFTRIMACEISKEV